MTSTQRVAPLDRPFDRVVELPGSKSLTNRALVCAALAEGESRLSGVLFADDTEAMLDNIERLGVGVVVDRHGLRVEVEGTNGVLVPGPIELDALTERHDLAVPDAVAGHRPGPVSARRLAAVARPPDGGHDAGAEGAGPRDPRAR